jgi:hypothetical protein
LGGRDALLRVPNIRAARQHRSTLVIPVSAVSTPSRFYSGPERGIDHVWAQSWPARFRQNQNKK